MLVTKDSRFEVGNLLFLLGMKRDSTYTDNKVIWHYLNGAL